MKETDTQREGRGGNWMERSSCAKQSEAERLTESSRRTLSQCRAFTWLTERGRAALQCSREQPRGKGRRGGSTSHRHQPSLACCSPLHRQNNAMQRSACLCRHHFNPLHCIQRPPNYHSHCTSSSKSAPSSERTGTPTNDRFEHRH